MKIIRVEWIDSNGCGHWESLDEAKNTTPTQVVTYGFLINDTEEFITISQSYCYTQSQVDNSITIPKCSIIQQELIKEEDLDVTEQKNNEQREGIMKELEELYNKIDFFSDGLGNDKRALLLRDINKKILSIINK